MEFRVLVNKLGWLQEYIAKLNKRATKLGLLPITLQVTGTPVYEVHAVQLRDAEGMLFTADYRLGFVTINVEGTAPKIDGWQLLAVLEHTNAGNIVRRVPGIADDVSLTQYNDAPAFCQHCNKIRPRKDTYVLLHDDGTLAQVGSQCLKDFLGHKNPEILAHYAETIESLLKEVRNQDGNNAIRDDCDFDTLSYLACTAAAIRVEGWCSGKMAMESYGKTATSTIASCVYNHEKAWSHIKVLPEDTEKAIQVRAWCLGTTDNSEYMHNLRTILFLDNLNYRRMGIAASVFSAYSKAMETKVLQEKQLYKDTYLAPVGTVVDTIVTVLRTVELDGDFGTTYLYIMIAPEGNMVKWFASNRVMETDKTYFLHGRVKNCDIYQEKKYTTVTRCKVMERKEV